LSKAQAIVLARAAFGPKGRVVATGHYQRERDNESLTDSDTIYAVNHGNIFDPPEPHPKTGNWTYRIEGPVLDGRKVIVVVAFESETVMTLLTIFVRK
jgi:hypothetical protein